MEDTIKLWFTEDLTDFDSEEGLNQNQPFELKRLNIIVGANNSGKSRFMRQFAYSTSNEVQMKYTTSISVLKTLENTEQFFRGLNKDIDIGTNITAFQHYHNLESNYQRLIDRVREIKNRLENTAINSLNSYPPDYERNILQLFPRQKLNFPPINDLEEILVSLESKKDIVYASKLHRNNLFYIDTLRSLKNLQFIEDVRALNPPLLARTNQDYEFKKEQIISGEDFFEFLTDSLLGMPEERQRVYDYQDKLSHYFFNNQDVVIIPNRKDNILQIKIGDDKQFPISQLGDGLQQIIILTYKAFLTTEPSFFFIEEPEMHLHAGYVKQLMKFLLNETDHYYMATSHSNYLLDMINEDKRIALYRVDKERVSNEEKKYETVIRRCDGDRTILQTLGVSPSSVFLANCTIWIEGITDRLYFVQYLKKYLDELKVTDEEKWEDYSRFIDGYHYAFVEYQGSNLEHWDFEVDSLEDVDSGKNKGLNAVLVTSNALVIADSDLKKKPRFNELKQQLGDKIAITQGKETENSLPRKFLVKKFFEMCPDNGLAKQGNKKKLAYSDEYEKYFTDSYQISTKGIGKYFDTALNKMRKDGVVPQLETDETSFTFSDGGQGTIKSKTNFCQDIVELMQSELWELTPSAIELCESIFQHIKCNNQ